MEIITIGNKNITVYSTLTLGNAQLERGRKTEREKEMDGAEDEREIFVNEASEVEVEKKTRQGHFFPHILSPFYSIY